MSEQDAALRDAQFLREAQVVSVGSQRIAQGDILRPRGRGSYRCAALIVLTADCDIAQGKYNAHLTCVPVYTWDDYFREIYVRAIARKAEHDARGAAHRIMQDSAFEGDDGLLFEELIEAPDADNSRLASSTPATADSLRVLARRVADLRRLVESPTDTLLEADALRHLAPENDKTQHDRLKRIVKRFCDQIKGGDLPGDTEIFESSLDGTACIAYLRTLFDVQASSIATRPHRMTTTEGATLFRSSRLTERYVFALTRKVGDCRRSLCAVIARGGSLGLSARWMG